MSHVLALAVGATILQGPGNVRKDLEADYALFANAWKRRALEPTYKLMTEDFEALGVDRNGKPMGRKEMIENTKQLLAATNISWPRHILSIERRGNTALATVEGHFTGTMPARAGGKASKFELIATTRDTWIYNGKLWRFRRMEIVNSTAKIDGKVTK